MAKSKRYVEYDEQFRTPGRIGWNLHTQCYLLGQIDKDYENHNITAEEWAELHDRVPISKEDKKKIDY